MKRLRELLCICRVCVFTATSVKDDLTSCVCLRCLLIPCFDEQECASARDEQHLHVGIVKHESGLGFSRAIVILFNVDYGLKHCPGAPQSHARTTDDADIEGNRSAQVSNFNYTATCHEDDHQFPSEYRHYYYTSSASWHTTSYIHPLTHSPHFHSHSLLLDFEYLLSLSLAGF